MGWRFRENCIPEKVGSSWSRPWWGAGVAVQCGVGFTERSVGRRLCVSYEHLVMQTLLFYSLVCTPFKIYDETPTEGEIDAAVRQMRRNRAGRHNHLRSEHLQKWLREVYPEETSTEPPKTTRYIKLVDIIHFMWETGCILTKLGFSVLVMIPKLNADTQGIRLIEVVWKVAEAVIDTLIKSVVQFHDVLHGFCAERGTRTFIMDLRLVQELESVDRDPLLLVFLDLRKAYGKLYRGRLF